MNFKKLDARVVEGNLTSIVRWWFCEIARCLKNESCVISFYTRLNWITRWNIIYTNLWLKFEEKTLKLFVFEASLLIIKTNLNIFFHHLLSSLLSFISSFFNPLGSSNIMKINRAKGYKCLNWQGGDLRDFEEDKEVSINRCHRWHHRSIPLLVS